MNLSRVCSNTSTFVPHDLAQCPSCALHVTRCAFDVHLVVGTTRRPTQHGFSGIPVRLLSPLWERRASLEKTLSLLSFLCEFKGSSRAPEGWKNGVRHSNDVLQAHANVNKYKDVYGIVHKAFAPAIVGMSGQIHADFLRLLWVLADN